MSAVVPTFAVSRWVTIGSLLATCTACSAGPDCRVEMHGAITTTRECGYLPNAIEHPTSGSTDAQFYLERTEAEPAPIVIGLPSGVPVPGTYVETDAMVQSSLFVERGGTYFYAASGNESQGPIGSYTLVLTSVRLYDGGPYESIYDIHGTLDATLVAQPGGATTEDLVLHFVF